MKNLTFLSGVLVGNVVPNLQKVNEGCHSNSVNLIILFLARTNRVALGDGEVMNVIKDLSETEDLDPTKKDAQDFDLVGMAFKDVAANFVDDEKKDNHAIVAEEPLLAKAPRTDKSDEEIETNRETTQTTCNALVVSGGAEDNERHEVVSN